jgi:beta-galactosidase
MPEETNSLLAPAGAARNSRGDDGKVEVTCTKFCELVQLRGAEVVAEYRKNWYAGRPAITRHQFGQGEAIYLATHVEQTWLGNFFGSELRRRGIRAPIEAGEGVELSVREDEVSEYLFAINQRAEKARAVFDGWTGVDMLSGETCCGELFLEPFGVRILKRPKMLRTDETES